MPEEIRTEFDRMYSILGGLLFEINLVNIYMSREEYPMDLLSRNVIISDIIGFIKNVHQEANITMTWNRFKDLLAVKLNIAVKNLDDAPDAEPYYTIWEQCEAQYIKEKQSDEYFDKWKAELKWMVDFYVKNKSKWLCKRKYLMLKQECFGTICERPCEAKKECAKCRKLQDVSPYSFITEWSQEREDELHQISSETKGRREISYGENVEERIDKYRQERAFRLAGNKTLGITTGLESFD
jgi:hypothetical protein